MELKWPIGSYIFHRSYDQKIDYQLYRVSRVIENMVYLWYSSDKKDHKYISIEDFNALSNDMFRFATNEELKKFNIIEFNTVKMRFKEGDIVQLSEYAKSECENSCEDPHDENGEVISIEENNDYPIEVEWNNGEINAYTEPYLVLSDKNSYNIDKTNMGQYDNVLDQQIAEADLMIGENIKISNKKSYDDRFYENLSIKSDLVGNSKQLETTISLLRKRKDNKVKYKSTKIQFSSKY